ncbi:hypothetical protein ASG01_04000 [Chryseobacterium sp. Leaf180]|uniref:hypothetical protein n=1 Tax=Chryseobacterium sp. Leaf180 TaxID=1736289 RepID=UPI0006F30437|nr:hypothetical protein [Chryseobacterium sp. Leaf180]KQR95025.1 hypothetical protein ASG01_04000 [Chryseobacterium sp. Leaf180]
MKKRLPNTIAMKYLIIALFLLSGCSKKEIKNLKFYQISIRYIGPQNAPVNRIVLTKSKPENNIFPTTNYQIEEEDLIKIEKICDSEEIVEKGTHPLVMVTIKKDNVMERRLYNKTNGIKILEKIQKILSGYNNRQLNDNYFDIIYATKKNWHGDGKIIGL